MSTFRRLLPALPALLGAFGVATSLVAESAQWNPPAATMPGVNGFTGGYFGFGAGFGSCRVETDLTLNIAGGGNQAGWLGALIPGGDISATEIKAKSKANPSGFLGSMFLGGGYVFNDYLFVGGELSFHMGDMSKMRRASHRSDNKDKKDGSSSKSSSSSSKSSSNSTSYTFSVESNDATINGQDFKADIDKSAADAARTDFNFFNQDGLNKVLDKETRPFYVKGYAKSFIRPLLTGQVKIRSQFGGALLLGMVQGPVRFGLKAGLQSTNVQMSLPPIARSSNWVKVNKTKTGFLTGLFADYKMGPVSGKGPIIGFFADFVLGSAKMGDDFMKKIEEFYKNSDKMDTAVFRAACREGDKGIGADVHYPIDNFAINLDMRRQQAKVTGTVKLKTPMKFGLRVLLPF